MLLPVSTPQTPWSHVWEPLKWTHTVLAGILLLTPTYRVIAAFLQMPPPIFLSLSRSRWPSLPRLYLTDPWNRVAQSVKSPPARQEKLSWKGKWQPTPVFLPGKSNGQRSLASCSLWGRKELGTTVRLGLLTLKPSLGWPLQTGHVVRSWGAKGKAELTLQCRSHREVEEQPGERAVIGSGALEAKSFGKKELKAADLSSNSLT